MSCVYFFSSIADDRLLAARWLGCWVTLTFWLAPVPTVTIHAEEDQPRGRQSIGGGIQVQGALGLSPGAQRWAFDTEAPGVTSAAIGEDGTIFVGSGKPGRVFAIHAASGALKWQSSEVEGQPSAPALGADGTVYVASFAGEDPGSYSGKLHAFDGATGNQKWAFRFNRATPSKALAVGPDGTVYAGALGPVVVDATTGRSQKKAYVYGFDPAKGEARWQAEVQTMTAPEPAVGSDGAVYVGLGSWEHPETTRAVALNPQTGAVVWSEPVPGLSAIAPTVGMDGRILVGVGGIFPGTPGRLVSLDQGLGSILWSVIRTNHVVCDSNRNCSFTTYRFSPAVVGPDGMVYAACRDGDLYAVDGVSGAVKWAQPLRALVDFAPALAVDGTLYLGAAEERLLAIDTVTGRERWSCTLGGLVSSDPTIGLDGTVYVGCNDGRLYAIAGSSPLTHSSWPKRGKDLRNSASAAVDGSTRIFGITGSTNPLLGGTLALSVAVEGTAPRKYQWRKNGEELSDGARVSGATTPGLIIVPTVSSDAADYEVVVADGLGAVNTRGVQVNLRAPKVGEIKWRYTEGKGTPLAPSADSNGTVFVSFSGGGLEALSGAGGRRCWVHPTGGGSAPATVSQDGLVLIMSENPSQFDAVMPETGLRKWKYGGTYGIEPTGAPAVAPDGTLYLRNKNDQLVALNGKTGARLWSRQSQGGSDPESSTSIGLDGSILVSKGLSTPEVQSFDPTTRALRWTFRGVGSKGVPPALGADGTIYFGAGYAGVCALDPLSGAKRWAFAIEPHGYPTSPISVGPDRVVYAGFNDGRVFALDPEAGVARWEFQAGAEILTAPTLLEDGVVLVGSADGNLYALSATTGRELWRFRAAAKVTASPVVLADGTIVFGSADGTVYALFGSAPLAKAPWPMLSRDPGHSRNGQVIGIPLIAAAPAPQEAPPGGTAAFSVVVSGSAPFAYQWSKDGVALSEDSRISGVRTSRLQIFDIRAEDSGVYRVTVSNDQGNVTSPGAELTLRGRQPGDLLWTFVGGSALSAPAMGTNSVVYVSSLGGSVYALDGENGTQRWAFAAQGGFRTTPVVGPDGTVFIGSVNSTCYALEGMTGAVRWSFKTGQPIYHTAAVGVDGLVYLYAKGTAFALDHSTGSVRWQRAIALDQNNYYDERMVSPGPVIGRDGTVYFGFNIGGTAQLTALDGLSGEIRWQSKADGYPLWPALDEDGAVHVGVQSNGVTISVMDPFNGAVRREMRVGFVGWFLYGPVIGSGDLELLTYAYADRRETLAVDNRSGAVKWAFKLAGDTESLPVLGGDGEVYLGALDGSLNVLDVASGSRRWSFMAAGPISSTPLRGTNGLLYVATKNARLHCLQAGTGRVEGPWPMMGQNPRRSGEQDPTGPIEILRQPQAQAAPLWGHVSLGVGVAGGRPVTCRWFKDGVALLDGTPVSGAGTPLLRIRGMRPGDYGWYHAAVSNSHGEALSDRVAITERAPGIGDLRWAFDTGAGIVSSPAMGPDGTLYVGSRNWRVYAIDGQTGAEKWHYTTGNWVESSPTVGTNGLVYIGSWDGWVYALHTGTGQPCWNFRTDGWIASSPAIGNVGVNGTVYIGSMDSYLYALDALTGQLRWRFNANSGISCSPALGTDGTVYFGSHRDYLYAVDGLTGNQRWSHFAGFGFAFRASPAIGLDGTIYYGAQFAASDKTPGYLHAFSPSGVKKWTVWYVSPSSPAIGAEGTLYIGGSGYTLRAVDSRRGSVLWDSTKAQAEIESSPAIASDGTVYYGSHDYRLYAVNGRDGTKVWDYATEGAIRSSPAIGPDGTVYVGSMDGRVYAVKGMAPLTQSAWPMRGQNAQHTSRAAFAAPPNILAHPQSLTAIRGTTVYLNVDAMGTPPLTYEWRMDGVRLSSGGPISGTDTASLIIDDVKPVNVGQYDVVVRNEFGSAVSAQVSVTLREPVVGDLRWTFTTPNMSAISSSPAVGPDGTVYVPASGFDYGLYAFDPQTGRPRWKSKVGGAPTIGPDGTLYVASGEVVALDPWTGETLRQLGGIRSSWLLVNPVMSPKGVLYVGSDWPSNLVAALDLGDGRKRWEVGLDAHPVGCSLDGRGRLFVATGSQTPKVFALDADTGNRRWEYAAGGSLQSAPVPGGHDTVLVVVGQEVYKLHALDASSGARVWSFSWGGGNSSGLAAAPVVGGDGTVYLSARPSWGSGVVYALDGSSGAQKWQVACTNSPTSLALDMGGTLYVPSVSSLVLALDAATGAVKWGMNQGGPVFHSATIGADGTIYLGSGDGRVFAVFGEAPPAHGIWPMYGHDPFRSFAASEMGGPPVLYYAALRDGSLLLEWNGKVVLQEAEQVTGPWKDVVTTGTSYVRPVSDSVVRWYRLREP